MKGSGLAIQSWNRDQTIAVQVISLLIAGDGDLPPVSEEATSSSISAWVNPLFPAAAFSTAAASNWLSLSVMSVPRLPLFLQRRPIVRGLGAPPRFAEVPVF